MKEKEYSEWLSKQGFDVLRHANCCKIAFNGGWESRQTEVDELQKQLIEQGQRFNVQTQQIASLKWQLKRLGYTDNGGELMKPPIGDAPKFDLLDELQKRVDKAIRLLVEAELYQSEPNIDLAVQALKGGIK